MRSFFLWPAREACSEDHGILGLGLRVSGLGF